LAIILYIFFFFFFSSRRRHTRSKRDWSSDVCPSDLHALDAGALVLVVPTVDTVAEAIEARNWAYFPPLGRRSNGGGQAFDAAMWGSVPGGYRNTINDNIVLVLMIETLEGLKNADEIAKVPGVTAIFAAS